MRNYELQMLFISASILGALALVLLTIAMAFHHHHSIHKWDRFDLNMDMVRHLCRTTNWGLRQIEERARDIAYHDGVNTKWMMTR